MTHSSLKIFFVASSWGNRRRTRFCIRAGGRSQDITTLDAVSSSQPLRDGIEVKSGSATLRITALRDDILRVRIAPTGAFPEDSSWAVLPGPRGKSVNVQPMGVDRSPSRTSLSLVFARRRSTSALNAIHSAWWFAISPVTSFPPMQLAAPLNSSSRFLHPQDHALRRTLLRTGRQGRNFRPQKPGLHTLEY